MKMPQAVFLGLLITFAFGIASSCKNMGKHDDKAWKSFDQDKKSPISNGNSTDTANKHFKKLVKLTISSDSNVKQEVLSFEKDIQTLLQMASWKIIDQTDQKYDVSISIILYVEQRCSEFGYTEYDNQTSQHCTGCRINGKVSFYGLNQKGAMEFTGEFEPRKIYSTVSDSTEYRRSCNIALSENLYTILIDIIDKYQGIDFLCNILSTEQGTPPIFTVPAFIKTKSTACKLQYLKSGKSANALEWVNDIYLKSLNDEFKKNDYDRQAITNIAIEELKLKEDKYIEIRKGAIALIALLGNLESKNSLKALCDAIIKDKNAEVRHNIASVLSNSENTNAINCLIDGIFEEKDGSNQQSMIQDTMNTGSVKAKKILGQYVKPVSNGN